jgi:quercetin dioxygenase-like cupin family protein
MSFSELSADSLSWTLPGRLIGDEPFIRQMLFEELVGTIPKDAQVRVVIAQGELAAGTAVPWHIHNGPLFALLLQGEMILQFPSEDGIGQEYHYKAGDVFVEPVGVLHRAYNPNPDVSLLSLGFQLTSPDRDHMVAVGDSLVDHRPRTAPRGGPQPEARRLGRLQGSRPDTESPS